MTSLIFTASLILTFTQSSTAPVTSYEAAWSSTSGTYTSTQQITTWVDKPDGKREVTVINFDYTTPKFLVLRSKNNFGTSANSNEVVVGKPQAPVLSDVQPGS